MQKIFPLLVVLLVISGCGAPTAIAPAPASPVGQVVGPPAPTAAPQPILLLPAPLYVLDNGQIARIDRDGKSRTLVTSEKIEIEGYPPIATFAVSPQGDLAFVVGDPKSDRLVLIDPRGGGRRILYEEADHELSDLVWSSDGAQIYMRLLNNREPPDTPSGLYQIAAAGGQPKLVRADDPVDDSTNPARTISGYRPFSTSPDGARLLLEIYSIYYGDCGLGVMPVGGGEIVRLAPPPSTRTYCGEAIWSPDGAAVYFLAGGDAGPTIWRGDTASGATAAMAEASVLTRAPYLLPDGALRFILVSRDGDGAGGMRFALADLAQASAAPTAIGPTFSEPLGLVIWSPNGGGAVAVVVPEGKQADVRWMPVGGPPVPLPNTTKGIGEIAWGLAE